MLYDFQDCPDDVINHLRQVSAYQLTVYRCPDDVYITSVGYHASIATLYDFQNCPDDIIDHLRQVSTYQLTIYSFQIDTLTMSI